MIYRGRELAKFGHRARSLINLLRVPVTVCAVIVFGTAQVFSQRNPLDDTAAFIHLAPNPVTAFTCEDFDINIQLTGTNVRVCELRFVFDAANYTPTSISAGLHPNLHVLPFYIEGDTLWVDAFFHPNFTGSTVVATLHFTPVNLVGNQTTMVGFLDGQGFSGTGEHPEPMIIVGDSTGVVLDGSATLPPESLIIVPMQDDSICLHWNPVRFDLDGDPVVNPTYFVEFEDTWNNTGVYTTVGTTMDTFFYDDYILYEFNPGDSGTVNAGVYRIRALKCQE